MCSNYQPVRMERLESLGRGVPDFPYGECYPGLLAPFLSNADAVRWLPGTFGLLPHWAAPKLARQTYNARSETVAEKPTYKHAWKERQLAIVPVECFFEPNYETGRPVRWRIERADKAAFGLAGIWEIRPFDHGPTRWSFSMLTINADDHPLMRRFHKPGDEKRSVVVLDYGKWGDWLSARSEVDVREFLQPFDPGLMIASADPRQS